MAWVGAELIRRMAEGDADACDVFYDRYARLAYPLIVRIVRDPADAADVLQEVFWEAWQAAATYDPARGSPEAWIVMRARTRAIDRLQVIRRRDEAFIAPVQTWPVAAASPSGLAILHDTLYMGALRGQALWSMKITGDTTTTPVANFQGQFGRIRTVEPSPDCGLWITTSNGGDKDSIPDNSTTSILKITVGRPVQ